MPLSCECIDEHDWYYTTPDNYTTLDTKRRKRCVSCKVLIELNSISLRFYCYRVDEDGREEPLAFSYMCEACSDLFLSLDELGFCLNLGEDMRELIKQYHEVYKRE